MKKKITELLASIYPDLRQLRDDYFMIGSCALLLAGLPVATITDLDLILSSRDADELKHRWSNRMRREFVPSDGHLFRSNFGRFDFGDIDIEVMGDLEVNKNGQWTPVWVEKTFDIFIGEEKIKIPTLEEQKRIFLLLGREKDFMKANMISERI